METDVITRRIVDHVLKHSKEYEGYLAGNSTFYVSDRFKDMDRQQSGDILEGYLIDILGNEIKKKHNDNKHPFTSYEVKKLNTTANLQKYSLRCNLTFKYDERVKLYCLKPKMIKPIETLDAIRNIDYFRIVAGVIGYKKEFEESIDNLFKE